MGRFYWLIVIVKAVGLVLLVLSGESGRTLGLDSDDFGRTLYLGIFGALVAAGILGSGMRLGDAARNLAAWLAIVLLFVAGYQYRYEFQDVASRLTAGFVPGSPVSVTGADGRTTVVLDKRPDGHFGARATVNGAPVTFVVDTGATTTVLTAQDAEAAGYDLAALSFTVPVSTANGMATAARVTSADIAIGAISRARQPLLVVAQGQLGQSLLGMSFLSALSGYDVRGDRMVMID